MCCAPCGNAGGPSSRRRARLFCFPLSLFGLRHTLDLLRKASVCLARRKWISHFLRRSAVRLHGFSYRLDGATGRRQWRPSRVLWRRKISLVQWVSFIPADGLRLAQTSVSLRDTHSWCSTFCVRPALRRLAPSSGR